MSMSFKMMAKSSVWRPMFATRPVLNPRNARVFLKPPTPSIFFPRPAFIATLKGLAAAKSKVDSDSESVWEGKKSKYDSDSESIGEGIKYPRPESVAWQKEIANSVKLVGYIDKPVELKYTQTGKAYASTKLAFKSYKSQETTWFTLKFFAELAEIAAEHVKARDYVHVSGSLDFWKADGEDKNLCGIPQVCVNTLNFVERAHPFPQPEDVNVNVNTSVQSKDAEVKFSSSGKKTAMDGASTEKLWQAFFAKPDEWWDNRENKKNPKAPDFKHKNKDEALWIESYKNPSWVKSKLGILDQTKHEEWQRNNADGETLIVQIDKKTTMDAASTEKLWQAFFVDPGEWWDNRKDKKNPKAPDFKHKHTGEVLWVESFKNPSWVKSQLDKVDERMKDSHQFTRPRKSLSSFVDGDLMF